MRGKATRSSVSFDEFAHKGFAMHPGFYSQAEIVALISALAAQDAFCYDPGSDIPYSLIQTNPAVKKLAHSDRLLLLARSILGIDAVPFHAIVLDKTKERNWGLDWHQDLKIAVHKKIDTQGYFNWSMEAGIQHVIPPLYVLGEMLTIRVHLDDCDHTNGAVWVIPASHQSGFIKKSRVREVVSHGKIFSCDAKAGAVMLMSPLLLHKSPYSLSAKIRRILQIEYRSIDLENGLEWFH